MVCLRGKCNVPVQSSLSLVKVSVNFGELQNKMPIIASASEYFTSKSTCGMIKVVKKIESQFLRMKPWTGLKRKIIIRSPKENFPSLLDELVKEHNFLHPTYHCIITQEFITGSNLASTLLHAYLPDSN